MCELTIFGLNLRF